MALSESEKQYILNRLDKMEQRQVDAILLKEKTFLHWLKDAANWIYKKIIDELGAEVAKKVLKKVWELFKVIFNS